MDKYEQAATEFCNSHRLTPTFDLIVEFGKQCAAEAFKASCDEHALAYEITSRGGLTKSQLHTLHLIRLLANDLDPERPKFKSTLDSIEAHVQALKKELKIDSVVQDSTYTFDGTDSDVFCNEEFHRKDLNCASTCGRNKGHKGDHSWYNDNLSNLTDLK